MSQHIRPPDWYRAWSKLPCNDFEFVLAAPQAGSDTQPLAQQSCTQPLALQTPTPSLEVVEPWSIHYAISNTSKGEGVLAVNALSNEYVLEPTKAQHSLPLWQKEVMFLVVLVCLSVCLWATLLNSYERIRINFYGGVLGGTMKKWLNLGGGFGLLRWVNEQKTL